MYLSIINDKVAYQTCTTNRQKWIGDLNHGNYWSEELFISKKMYYFILNRINSNFIDLLKGKEGIPLTTVLESKKKTWSMNKMRLSLKDSIVSATKYRAS